MVLPVTPYFLADLNILYVGIQYDSLVFYIANFKVKIVHFYIALYY